MFKDLVPSIRFPDFPFAKAIKGSPYKIGYLTAPLAKISTNRFLSITRSEAPILTAIMLPLQMLCYSSSLCCSFICFIKLRLLSPVLRRLDQKLRTFSPKSASSKLIRTNSSLGQISWVLVSFDV